MFREIDSDAKFCGNASGRIVIAGQDAGSPTLEILPNAGSDACILFYPGTMLAPGHYALLLYCYRQAGFAVAALHLAGHGLQKGKKGFTFASLLAQGLAAESWLRSQGYAHIIVSGHSQGGIFTLAHAAASKKILAAFAISAVYPQMVQAASLTRFAPFADKRETLMSIIRCLARIIPWLPVPMPIYLQISRVLKGKPDIVRVGKDVGRISYPLGFIASLFDKKIDPVMHCPFWLFNAVNDALFTPAVIDAAFERIQAPRKTLVRLAFGGHLAPFNPVIANYIARYAAAACAGMGVNISLNSEIV